METNIKLLFAAISVLSIALMIVCNVADNFRKRYKETKKKLEALENTALTFPKNLIIDEKTKHRIELRSEFKIPIWEFENNLPNYIQYRSDSIRTKMTTDIMIAVKDFIEFEELREDSHVIFKARLFAYDNRK